MQLLELIIPQKACFFYSTSELHSADRGNIASTVFDCRMNLSFFSLRFSRGWRPSLLSLLFFSSPLQLRLWRSLDPMENMISPLWNHSPIVIHSWAEARHPLDESSPHEAGAVSLRAAHLLSPLLAEENVIESISRDIIMLMWQVWEEVRVDTVR